VTAVAIVLPGGRADSFDPTRARHLTGVRMRPFARALQQAGAARGVEVWTVRYRVRGWNGTEMSPVADARWVLDEVRSRHAGLPIVLVGHSMGGRTAVRIANADEVTGVVALAPWLPDGDPVEPLTGKRLLVVHGNLDKVTSPRASRRFVERARAVAAHADYVSVRGDTHAMVLRAPAWHRISTATALTMLGLQPLPDRVERAVARGTI
jgi:dienelactone hydrolase